MRKAQVAAEAMQLAEAVTLQDTPNPLAGAPTPQLRLSGAARRD